MPFTHIILVQATLNCYHSVPKLIVTCYDTTFPVQFCPCFGIAFIWPPLEATSIHCAILQFNCRGTPEVRKHLHLYRGLVDAQGASTGGFGVLTTARTAVGDEEDEEIIGVWSMHHWEDGIVPKWRRCRGCSCCHIFVSIEVLDGCAG